MKYPYLFFIFLLFAPYCFAKEAGEVGGQVLKLGGHSRPIGLGEAFVAISDDVSAIYYNPAGLVQLKDNEITLTHMNRIIDIRSFDFAYARPLNDSKAFGCALYLLYTQDSVRDEITGNETGYFMNYNTYLILGYAQKTKNLSIGLNSKIIYNQLQDYKSSNVAFDLGTLYIIPNPKLQIGANLQNIATGLKFTDEIETLPLNLKAGISYKALNSHLTLAFDMNKPIDSNSNFSVGGEYLISRNIFLRMGYKYKLGGLQGLCCGFGIKHKKYQIDYAFTPHGDLGNTCHRFSFLTRF
ncbi:MAG: PorV/PorQ family protein [bacterium]